MRQPAGIRRNLRHGSLCQDCFSTMSPRSCTGRNRGGGPADLRSPRECRKARCRLPTTQETGRSRCNSCFQPAFGWHAETGIHVLRLIFLGGLDRHPRLKLLSGHWGEFVAGWLDRLDETVGLRRPRQRLRLPRARRPHRRRGSCDRTSQRRNRDADLVATACAN